MTIIELAREIAKPEHLALDNNQLLATLQAKTIVEGSLIPATTVNQLFANLGLSGAIKDIAETVGHQFRDEMLSVMWSIGGNHPFNFIEGSTAGDGNLAMLDSMIANLPDLAVKLQQFRAVVYDMANKKRPFVAVTLPDVVAARTAQLDGEWHEIDESSDRQFVVRLSAAPVETTYIVVQAQDQYGDGVSAWYHATALHGIATVREYQAALPYNGYPRKLRWKCDYLLSSVVSVR